MAFGDSDLPAMFADMGEPVTYAGRTFNGFFDTGSNLFEHGGMGSLEEQSLKITAPLASFGATPMPGQSITARGVTYKIQSRRFLEDGSVIELSLQVAS